MPTKSREMLIATASSQMLALQDALVGGNRRAIGAAFSAVARSRGIAAIAAEAGVAASALHAALADANEPDVAMLSEVAKRLMALSMSGVAQSDV